MISLSHSWTECQIGTLGYPISGLSFRPQDAKEASGPELIACFRTSNIQQSLEKDDVLFIPRNLLRSERQILQEGDILISTANSDNLVGKCVIAENLSYEATLGGFITAFRVNSSLVIPRFFYYWLSSPLIQARMRSLARRTTNIANLAMSDFIKVKIPLPPLSEQQRIVGILQEAEEISRLRVKAEAKTAELAPAMFNGIFGSPSEWKGGSKLGDLVKIVGGGTPSRSVQHYYSGEIPWATSKDIKKLYLEDTEEHVTEEAVQSSATNVVPEGSVLVVVKSKILAHTLPISITRVPMCFGQDIKGLIPESGITPEFLVYSLQAQLNRILSRARGANTEGLTLEVLKSLDMPKPSPQLMERFRVAYKEVRSLEEASASGNRMLFLTNASLSAHAFSGQLTADWREANKDKLAAEARERDVALKEVGVIIAQPKRTTAEEIADLLLDRHDGVYSDLNQEQLLLLREVRRMVGGVDFARYFTADQLSKYLAEGPLRRNPYAVEGHLAVLAARGIIIPVSREEQTEDTGEYVFANAYRLPLEEYGTWDDGESKPGDHTRTDELGRLANVLEKERLLP